MSQLIITIPDSKLNEFMSKFLFMFPKPDTFTGTDKQWLRKHIVMDLNNLYRQAEIQMTDAQDIVE